MIGLYIGSALVAVLLAVGYAAFVAAHVRRPSRARRKTMDPVAQWRHLIDPAVARLKAGPWEDLYITSHDGLRLHGVYFDRGGADTVLCFHGYRSTPFGDFCIGGTFYLDEGCNVLFVDQRAHGESEGRYISYGIHERLDVKAWVEHMAPRTSGRLFLSGISMGAATVLMAADLELPKVAGIMADCGFTSPRAIIKKVIGDMHLPTWPILPLMNLWCRLLGRFSQTEYSTLQSLAQAKYPILFVHGKADDFVPCSMTEESYAACSGDKELVLVGNAGHGLSFLIERERCQAAARAFMERCR